MLNLNDIIRLANDKGFVIDTRPFALNLIGVRNSNATDQKSFDDHIAYFYYDNDGKVHGKVAPATTDPSTYWLENPMNELGGAILKSGQYLNSYSIGLHKNKYQALVQTKPVVTIRDNDRNAYINYLAPTSEGMYGINIHKATTGKDNIKIIDKDSAGCQVFRDVDDFNTMMNLAKVHQAKYGNSFSYGLVDERDVVKRNNTIGLGILALGIAWYLYKKNK